MANRYSRALKQIKDKTLDEKLQLLSEIPTNNTAGVFVDTPGRPAPEETIPGDIDSPLNLEQDGDGEEGYDGRDTTGLFESDGTIRAIEPPGDTSYVLGPMISMWYAWANYTQIGYVRQSDRRMVNLGRIVGEMSNWDGVSGFTSYGQLTLEQAVWFKDQSRSDYRAFYPGPPSNPADEFGRYLGSMIDTTKSILNTLLVNPFQRFLDGIGISFSPEDVLSLLLGTDDSILTDLFSNSALGKQGLVFLGYLTNQLGDTIDNKFLGQNYVNDSFANMKLGYDNNGKPISSVGDNIIGSGQYPTYDPSTNEIKLKFNYDFKPNWEELKNKEGLYGGLAGELQKGVYNALGPYSVDAQVGPSFVGPITGSIFGAMINAAKGLGGGKPTPGEITISPQQLQQINPQAYNQLVNKGDVPNDAANKPSQNKQAPAEGTKLDPKKTIETLKQNGPPELKMALEPSMDNFKQLSPKQQNAIMKDMEKNYNRSVDSQVDRFQGDELKSWRKLTKQNIEARRANSKTEFKDGYMITTSKTFYGKPHVSKVPLFPTSPKKPAAVKGVMPGKPGKVKGVMPGKPGTVRPKGKAKMMDHHEPSGKLLTENQKRIIRDIKKPVQVKEIPSKVKVSPKLRNKNKTVGGDMMKTPNVPNQFKPPAPNIWSTKDREANIRASQEKKNQVLELVGAAEHHWTYLTEESRKKKQEKVNEMMSAEYDKQMELLYEKHRIKESKIDKAISAFRKPTDIKPEFPKEPPPQMDPKTGMHPKYGKNYKHDKLDPQSAEAMPPTGNPEIDANIKKATNAKEKARKLKILMGKTKRG